MGNGGGKYQLYAAGSRNVGETLSVTVSSNGVGTGANTLPGADPGRYLIVGLGLLGIALVAGGGWLYLRDRKRALADIHQPAHTNDGNANEILDAIIALDDQHAAGNIADDVYQQRRAELKAPSKLSRRFRNSSTWASAAACRCASPRRSTHRLKSGMSGK